MPSPSRPSRAVPAAPPGPPPELFAALARGGRCTQVVAAHRPWDPQHPSLRAARDAARRGLRIERSFLLAHRGARDDARLVEQQKLDREAGIATRLLHAGPHVAELGQAAPDGLELGLWDDAVCGTAIPGERAGDAPVVAWRESRDPEVLARARGFFALLDARVGPVDAEPPDDAPEDPVVDCVPVAEALAPACRVDPETGRSCAGFHLAVAYWRVFGLVGGTFCDRESFARGLAPVFTPGARPRILVSGTGDYSLFSLLLFLARRAGAEPEFTVCDLCPTPLGVTRWYAERARASVRTVVADAVTLASDEPFDAVCTHYFMGWLPLARRPELVRTWARLLRPGGRVVTNLTVRPGPAPAVRPLARAAGLRFQAGQPETFLALARARARAFRDFLPLDVDAVVAMAEAFLPGWRSRFEPSYESDLPGWFEDAGFELACELGMPASRLRPDWNPAPELDALRRARSDRRDAFVVAVRR